MTDVVQLTTEIDLFGQDVTGTSTIDRDLLSTGLYHTLKDITLEEFCSYFVNGFDAMVSYANLCDGQRDGQRISLLFNPHRLDTGTKKFPISLYQALKDERFVRGLARVVLLNKRKGIKTDLLYACIGIGVQGTSYVQEFPPHVARDLALEYRLSPASKILDPCAGWGGRMLGFSAVVDSYTCCEPSSRTAAGLRKLLPFIQSFRQTFNATIHEAPFEDVTLPHDTFDFAMTSPPYYDTEWYAPGETANSFNRYSSFDAWCAGFYAPLIHRTMAALKPGGSFIINIGSRTYPLNDRLFAIARDRYDVEKQKGRLSASSGLGKEGEGETFYEVRRRDDPVNILTVPSFDDVPASALTLDVEPRPETAPVVESPVPDAPDAPHIDILTLLAGFVPLTAPDTVELGPELSPHELIASFEARGHALGTRDGKLLIANAPRLTSDDRELLRTHKHELLPHLPTWPAPEIVTLPDPEPVTSVSVNQSLAQFLRSHPSNDDWEPDEPPSLDGIDEIVLNFATDGLRWDEHDRPVGLTVGTLDGQLIRFLPFKFAGGNHSEDTIKAWAIRELRNKKIVNSKTRFDLHMSRVWGVDLESQGCTFSDVQHTAALLDDHRKAFRLDLLARDYLPDQPAVERVDERQHHLYHASEVAERERYTVQLVGQLLGVMRPQIAEQELTAVQALEDDVIPAVVEMEKNGALLDMPLLEQYSRDAMAAHDALMKEVIADVGFPFDHTAKSWQRLFETLGLPPTEGNAEHIITAIDHPTVKKAHLAAQYSSLNSKTFKAYRENVDANGVLRFDINQLRGDDGGTVSGRFSIGYVQQVPNHDNHAAVFGEELFPRRLYIPAVGDYLEADAAQIEYRLFAHYANNASVLAAYKEDPWLSFHKMTWGMMKAYKADMLYGHQKNFNFARQYGAKSVKLAVMMGLITGAEGDEIREQKRWNDPKLAVIHEIEAAYKKMMPEGDALLDYAGHLAKSACDQYCKKHDRLHHLYPHRGYVKTLLGRRSRFPTNYKTYIGLNRVLQGTGADIMKRKIVELHRERQYTGFVLRLTVHDAVGGDATTPETLGRVHEILNRQSFPELRVPILWECATGPTWADCKK